MKIYYDKIHIKLENYLDKDEQIMIIEKFSNAAKISFISQTEMVLETSKKTPQELKSLLISMTDYIKTIMFVIDSVIEINDI